MLLPDAAVKLQGDNYRPRQTLDVLYVPIAYVLTPLLEIMFLKSQPTLLKISEEGSSQVECLIRQSYCYKSLVFLQVYSQSQPFIYVESNEK
jgi:hypothetical protein